MNPDIHSKNEGDRSFNSTKRSMYQFSPDEIRVMRECNKESFWKRSLPIGTALGVAAYVGVNTGYLKRNARYGPTPKVVVSVIMGYFLGKFSYQQKCAEKLMQLPNSQIGELLRKRKKGFLQESLDSSFGPSMSLAPFTSSTDQYSDIGHNNSLDIDTTRPDYEGLDDNFRPSVDNPVYEEEMPPVQKHTTSYDELRKKNRDEYQQSRVGLYRNSEPKPGPTQPTNMRTTEEEVKPAGRTNKYGDIFS